jgi:hypothetical protein
MNTGTRTKMDMRIILASLPLFMVAGGAKATDLRQRYIGRSGCAAVVNSPGGHYGIRLYKEKRAYLEAHEFKNETLLAIVQRSSDTDECGIIRDVVRSGQGDSSFVFECVDRRNPAAVVVGTWPAEHPSVSGPAVEAWRINLQELRFVRLHARVSCSAGDYAGSDEGDDLADLARKRAVKK